MAEQGTLRRFLRNIASNAAGYFVNIVIGLLLVPIVVGSLGDEMYGLWALVVSLTGYYGLLDLGVRSAVGQYVSRYWAKRDMEGVNRTLNTAIVLLSCVAVFAMIVTLILAYMLPRWIDAEGVALVGAQWALVITGLEIGFTFPMAVYTTVTYAKERFDISNAVGITMRVINAALVIWVLRSGHGILGLAIVKASTSFVGWSVHLWVAYRVMPGLKLRPRMFSRESVRELTSFGIFNFLVNAAERVLDYTDVLVVAAFMSATAITHYAIGATLVPYYFALITAITWTMTPYATALDAAGDRDKLRKLFFNGTRATLFVAAVLGSGLILLGADFLGPWVGEKFVTGEVYTSSATILTILACACLVRCAQSPGRQILFGMRRVKFLAALAFGELIINLGLSLWLVQEIGLPGIAIGTLVPVFLLTGVAQAFYVVRALDLSWRQVLLNYLRAAVPVMAAMGAVYFLVVPHIALQGWPRFLVLGTLIVVPVPIVGYTIVMNPDERRKVTARFFRRRPAET